MEWVEAVSSALPHHCLDMLSIGCLVAHNFYNYNSINLAFIREAEAVGKLTGCLWWPV